MSITSCVSLWPFIATSFLRPHHAEIEGKHEEYAVDYNFDVNKIGNWPRKKGPYLQFLTHFVCFDIIEWMLLEQVDECEHQLFFLSSDKLNNFFKGKRHLYFAVKFPTRNGIFHK